MKKNTSEITSLTTWEIHKENVNIFNNYEIVDLNSSKHKKCSRNTNKRTELVEFYKSVIFPGDDKLMDTMMCCL